MRILSIFHLLLKLNLMNVSKFYSFLVLAILTSLLANAQTTYLPLNSEEYHVLDRLETFSGNIASFSSGLKPVSRKDEVQFLKDQKIDAQFGKININHIDLYNINRALSISGEWDINSEGIDGATFSKKPILKYFYQRQADFLHVHNDDFFLVVNPIIYTQAISEYKSLRMGSVKDNLDYINIRGLELRGRILNKVGFYTMLADNQERPVSYVREYETANQAFPGYDYYRKLSNNNYDLFLARGYIDANFLKDHLNVTFGFDKNFIGDGIRSLFLSDFAAASTFLRLRSHYGKFTYENLFMELAGDNLNRGADALIPKKYAAFHQLNFKATHWLNIGLFESTMFSKQDHFNIANLAPVILLNSAAHALGAKNKSSIGFSFKAIALKKVQIYGQGYFDGLDFNNLGNGSWKNQFGVQLGAKYFDAFSIAGLDLQGELNMVRPFTYSSDDSLTNYTQYRNALAHPLGAGFAELIGVAKYQPIYKLYLTAKVIYSVRGTDSTDASNFGNNILKSNNQRSLGNYGYDLTAGDQLKGTYFNFNAAYELRPRLFLEGGVTYLNRKFTTGQIYSYPNSTSIYGGIRWNFSRREYDSY